MLATSLLIPAVMIGFGSYSVKRAPKKINMWSGYRTSMSMKNKETWEFAHHYNGRIWRAVGWVMLVPTVAAMALVLGKITDTVGIFGGIVVVIQTVVLICSIIPTEIALRKNFDKNGRRRK